jgi:hypothetical protein
MKPSAARGFYSRLRAGIINRELPKIRLSLVANAHCQKGIKRESVNPETQVWDQKISGQI